MDFVAIDFETADGKQQTPCSLGMTIVKNGQIKDCRSYLINPESDFSDYNISVHGIRPEDVASSPTFPELWDELLPVLKHYPVVAHNIPFDRSVLLKTCNRYLLDPPPMTMFCTMQLCRENYALKNYRLDTVCRALNIELDTHHQCGCDSRCCAEIMLHLLNDENTYIHDVEQFSLYLKRPAPIRPASATKALSLAEQFVQPHLAYCDAFDFSEMNVAITGNVPGFDRSELIDYITAHNGVYKTSVSKKVNYVIVGLEDAEIVADKVTFKTSKIISAEKLIAAGVNVKFVSGSALADRIAEERGDRREADNT